MIDVPFLTANPHFGTFTFWMLFACIFAGYLVLRKGLFVRNVYLLGVSYLLYVLWDVRFLFVVLLSTAIGYLAGLALERFTARRQWILAIGIVAQLSILLYCKYAGFFVDTARNVMALAGMQSDWAVTGIFLPLGLSFYSFQIISYIVDVYRGKQAATSSIIEFGLYVAFFPKMIAGPIERASHFLPQIRAVSPLTRAAISEGSFLIAWGLVQKIVIADNAAYIVRMSLVSPDVFHVHTISALLALSIQIYGDFSGYSDCARGVARLIGFELTPNFRAPYLASSVREFWRRWHISLSDWCRDYVYFPLGGNRKGLLRTCANLFITMVLVGLWHGPAWGYLAWGAYHGALLAANHVLAIMRPRTEPADRVRRLIGMATTFALVSFGWLFFQDVTTEPIMRYIAAASIFEPDAFLTYALLLGTPIVLMHYAESKTSRPLPVAKASVPIQLLFHYVCVYALILLHPVAPSAFIYAKF